MRNKRESTYFRVQCGFDFFGTLIHHSATSLIIVSLTTHREIVDRNGLSVTLPLVVQHWSVLTRYIDTKLCTVLCLTVEIVWEWQVFYFVQDPCLSWNYRWCAHAMLIAHWFYLSSAGMALVRPDASKVLHKKRKGKHRHSVVHDALATAEMHHSKQETNTKSKHGFAGGMLSNLSQLPEPQSYLKKVSSFFKEVALTATSYKATPADDSDEMADWSKALGEDKQSGEEEEMEKEEEEAAVLVEDVEAGAKAKEEAKDREAAAMKTL